MSSVQALSQALHRYDDLYPEYEKSRDGLKVSESEYWKTYYEDPDFVYEWNNGFLEVRPMANSEENDVYQWIWKILSDYFSTFPIGRIITLEIGFRLELPHQVSVRKPDLAVVLNSNPVKMDRKDCSYSGTFDLCIESVSHSNLRHVKRDTVDKKNEYEGVGVDEYYILDAQKLETAFYYLGKGGKYQKIEPVEGDIIKSRILPGFQFRKSDLDRRPSLKEMAEDEVYRHYAFPAYTEQKQRAEKAEHRAEQEKQRAEQEKQRAEQEKQRADKAEQKIDEVETLYSLEKQRANQLAAKLKELGMLLD